MKKYLFILILFFICLSCEEQTLERIDPNIFTFRIIENAETGGCKDLSGQDDLIYSEEPLITLTDISYYQVNSHTFYLTKKAAARIYDLETSLARKPFGILYNDDLLLNGYFYQAYLSTGCDWIVTDPTIIKVSNSLHLDFGYASSVGPPTPDPRENKLMLEVLRNAQKLRD